MGRKFCWLLGRGRSCDDTSPLSSASFPASPLLPDSTNKQKFSRFKLLRWPFKWCQKLRDRMPRSLSCRKNVPQSDTSDTRRIRAHEQLPGDWDDYTSASNDVADSIDMSYTQYSVVLQPATSSGSYCTADSFMSAPSIPRSEDPPPQEEGPAPEDSFSSRSANSNSLARRQKNTQTQVGVFDIPVAPDSDPPGSPLLSSESALSRSKNLRQSFIQTFRESRWLAAGDKLRAVQDAGMSSAESPSEQQLGAENEVTELVQSLASFEQAMLETGGYQQSSREPLQMFYRPPTQGQVHNIRAVADFAVKSGEVLALAREFDLVKTWNWTAADSAILETRGDFDMDALAVLKMPWPYKHRFAAFSFKVGDLLDERGSVAVLFKSCNPEGSKPPPGAQKAEEVRILDGSGFRIEPCWTTEGGETVEGCRVCVQMNIDPLMAVVPAVIINFVLMILSPVIYRLAKAVVTTARKPGTKLHARMKQRAAFYNRVDSRVEEYLLSEPVDKQHVMQP